MATTSASENDSEARPLKAKALTAGILIALFVLAMLIRCYWYYGPAVAPADTYGEYHYVVSGNDPDYHKRSIDYALETGHALTWDPLMNYPNGGPNPNPPAFAWSSMMLGILVSPGFNFDVTQAVWMFFEIIPAFWAALTIIPVYYFTRDMFGRKPAYFAAFFIAVMAGNVERTPLGFSDHDSYTMFFAVTGFFFFMRALKNLEEKTWVKKWRNMGDIANGTVELFAANRVAVLYSVLTGVCIGAIMLGWKGATYIFAILFMYFLVHAWVKRFRREDPFGIAVMTLIAMGVPLLISFPYYYNMQFIHWYETPFFVFLATSILAVVTVVTREQPWMMVLLGLGATLSAAYLALMAFFPTVFNVLLGFQGYFVRDKLYTTIAEAQPPDFSRMVYSYGEYVFYFALIALVYSAWRLPKERWRNDYIFTIMWCIMAIYMAMSAVRFMYNATPVFAILGGYVTWVIIKLLDFKKVVKTYRGLNEGRWVPRWHAVKSSVKVRHVVGAIFIGYMVMGSATWYGIDAGIPYETKKQLDNDIYNFLPSQIRPAGYDPAGSGLWWFGSFGTAFPSDYWTDGLYWFATQDTNDSAEDRPAFVAWWDYGHWCMHMGEHPSIADNFQQGVEISGSIITAQNETSAVAYFIARVTEGSTGDSHVRSILENYLGKDTARDFIDIEEMKDIVKWRREIVLHPDIFGKRTPDMNDLNAKWAALAGILTSRLGDRELASLYDEICHVTQHEIRYFAADSRMFPFQARNTGIYYAPVKLSDQDINDFMITMAVGNDGQEYDPANIPASVRSDRTFRILDYKLYYEMPFYNSMFYKAYIGYSPADAGVAPGTYGYTDIPSMVGNMRSGQYPPMQGWNLSHFRLEYRTSYWNPYNESTGLANHSEAWKVVPPWTAARYRTDKTGVVDDLYRNLYQGVFFLKYYHGAYVNGTVRTDTGKPVPNARVTVYDDLPLAISYYPGVPHGYTFTDQEGRFSLLAPYGNVTLKVTNGGMASTDDLLLLKENRELHSEKFYVSDDQAMRMEIDLDHNGILDYNIYREITVQTSALNGRAFFDDNEDGGWTAGADTPLSGELVARNASLGLEYRVKLGDQGSYLLQNITPADYSLNVVFGGAGVEGTTAGVNPGANDTIDLPIKNIHIEGNLTFENSTPAAGLGVGVMGDGGAVIYSNRSNATGTYWIERILPGQYNISLTSADYIHQGIPITMNQSGNLTLDLSAISVFKISGHAGPGASVSFQSTDNGTRWVSATADAAGNYECRVSAGNYTVYTRALSGTGMQVNLTRFTVSAAPAALNIGLEKGIRFNGTVFRDMNANGTFDPYQPGLTSPPDQSGAVPSINLPEYQANAGVEIEGAGGKLFLPANALGYFEAWLPAGEYTARAFKNTTETEAYVNTTVVGLAAPTELNLSLGRGTLVSGKVFWDQNGDDVTDEPEGIGGARIIFRERKYPDRTLEALTGPNGTYMIYLPQITDYTVAMDGFGFENGTDFLTTGTDPLSRNFKLEPTPVDATVRLTAGGKPVPAGVVGHFVGATPGTKNLNLTTDGSGVLSGKFVPGTYTIAVSQNITRNGGTVNLTHFEPLTIGLGAGHIGLAFATQPKVYVSGVVYYDENGDGVAQRTEYRNSLVKFVPENLTSDTGASSPGIPYVPGIFSQSTVEGRYEVAVPAGNYTVWSLIPLPSPQGPDLVHLGRVPVDSTRTLNLPLLPGCQVRGMVFSDLNSNGLYDSGENRNAIPIAVSAGGPTLLTVASDPSGFFEITLPQDGNYTLTIDNLTRETLSDTVSVPIQYTARANLSTPSASLLEQNITMLRRIGVAGRLTYDRNSDRLAGADEGVAGATAIFTDAQGNRLSALANSSGNYDVYLDAKSYNITVDAPGYCATAKGIISKTVLLEDRQYDLELVAQNASVSFRVLPPGSSPGTARITGGAEVSLRALDPRGANVSGHTDVRGVLQLAVAPGVYSVRVSSGSLIYFGGLDLMPSGSVVALELNLTAASRVWGSVFYHDDLGILVRPAWTNLTFNTTLLVSGQNYTASLEFGGLRSAYELFLPAGNFSASALFVRPEGAQNISYNALAPLNVSAGERSVQWDVGLAKVKDHSVGLFWDETGKVTMRTNSTANYTLLLSNNGNEKFTMNLGVTKPGTWSVNLTLDKITLAPGENLTIGVEIRAPPAAASGDNIVTVNASSSELPAIFSNISQMSVYIIQEYGVSLGSSTVVPTTILSGVSYSFQLKNRGNGYDTFNLSVTGPHGWNLTLSDYNPQVAGGESKDFQLTAIPFEGARIERGLTARITASSKNELAPPAEYVVNLTFPKLSAGNLKIKGQGVSEPKGDTLPGFEALVLLAAAGVAAVVMRRRWAR